MSKQYQRAKEIFLKACDLPTSQRGEVIARECAGDRELLAEVHSLLAHHDASNVRETEPKRLEDAETAPRGSDSKGSDRGGHFHVETGTPQPTPERIGPYRIVRRLGVGGMGIVYLALRDDDQFKKRVAIKVIKKGMDSEEILRRFDQERQVLSALNHPNIARMIDGGATPDGLPYFVMEYIEGMPIDEYCDKNRLRIDERLELFRVLCQAVHHAHQNLIVHRDIKPSNVVVMQDGTLKLLDFGIAKLLNPDLVTFANEPTATMLRLMTPEYASPEQVRGDPLSTASDVYSLGVLLYELVTGRRPYRFKTRLQSEIERVICTEDPEKPSTAITHQPEEPPPVPPAPVPGESPAHMPPVSKTRPASTIEEIAKLREAKPERLRRRLTGDIDNIVMMAMRKEPRRRYTSAEQFGEDIRRHLDGMPIIARPATWNYRLGKFVRRNRAGIAAAAAMFLLLIGWAISASILWRQADEARRRALEQEQVAVSLESRAKQSEAAAIHARDDYATLHKLSTDLLLATNRELSLSKIPGVMELRDSIVSKTHDLQEIVQSMALEAADPLSRARAFIQLGDLQGGIRSGNHGDDERALDSYRTALGIMQPIAAASPENITLQRELATLKIRIGDLVRSRDKNEAAAKYKEALETSESLARRFPDDRTVQNLYAMALLSMGDMQLLLKQGDAAIQYYARSKDIRERILRDNPSDPKAERELVVAMTRIADSLSKRKQFQAANDYFQRIIEIRERLLRDDPHNTQRRRDLAMAHLLAGQNWRFQNEWPRAYEALKTSQQLIEALVKDDPNDLRLTRDLANILKAFGDASLAEYQTLPATAEDAEWQRLISSGREYYGKAATYMESLAKNSRSASIDFAELLFNLGALDMVAKDLGEAAKHLTSARDWYRTLAATDSEFEVQLNNVESALAGLGATQSP